MSKVYFKNVEKKLKCLLCSKDNEFTIHSNISVIKESPFQYEKIPVKMISCSCGYTILLTNVTFEREEGTDVRHIIIDKMDIWNS